MLHIQRISANVSSSVVYIEQCVACTDVTDDVTSTSSSSSSPGHDEAKK